MGKSKKKIKHRKLKILAAVVLGTVVLAGVYFVFIRDKKPVVAAITSAKTSSQANKITPTQSPSPTPTPTQVATPQPTPVVENNSIWPVNLTAEEAASITVVVNKKHKLPSDYIPPNLTPVYNGELRDVAATAINELINGASASGYSLTILSPYRSYATQEYVYNGYVQSQGQAATDTFSARPGFSEHQTGLVADVGGGSCSLMTCFGGTAEGQWVANNAQNYGFIVRYPSGKEEATGYQYEPWHLRYVGIDVAKAVVASGKTLDEYYGVTAGGYE